MAITATLVQITLAIQMLVFVVLLAPVGTAKRRAVVGVLRSKWAGACFRAVLAVYVMVFILFLDSIYKMVYDDVVLKYLYETNMYLTGFTLFNAAVLYILVGVLAKFLSDAERSQDLTKQSLAHKEFVDSLLRDLDESSNEIKRLREEKTKSEALMRQHRNNESAFFELLEKYNTLKHAQESRKAR